MSPDEIQDSGLGNLVDREFVHGYFCVLPMGFSWAFYLAQEGLRSAVRTALPDVQFVTDLEPVPSLKMKPHMLSSMQTMRSTLGFVEMPSRNLPKQFEIT